MTDKTAEERDVEAVAFVGMVKDNMPNTLRPAHILDIVGTLITSYGNRQDAASWLTALINALAGYYAAHEDDETHNEKTQ